MESNIIKGPTVDYDVQNRNIGEILIDMLNEDPDYLAWIDPKAGKQMTYAQMKDSSIRLAIWMRQQGFGSGDVITLCSHNCLNNFIAMYATFYIGAVYNSWHHEFPLASVRHALKVTKPKVIFTCTSMVDTIRKAVKLENVNVKLVAYDSHPDVDSIDNLMNIQNKQDVEEFRVQKIENSSTELASLLFSSGSSGPPKCVMMTYDRLLNLTFVTASDKPSNTVVLWYSSPYWIAGTHCMLASVFQKFKVIVCSEFDPQYICQQVETYQINVLFGNPNLISSLCKNELLDRFRSNSMTRTIAIFCGGTKLSDSTVKQFHANFPQVNLYQVYGMTEAGVIFVQTGKCKNSESVGHIVPNTQAKIIDMKTGKNLGPNENGEICYKSSKMTNGYYNDPESTAATIDKDGWLHTGDIGYYDENGEFFIVDRIKNVIRFRYHHIYPFEIVEHLLRHPDVLEAGVTTIPHEEDVEHAIAFVEKVPGSKVNEAELVEYSAELGYYKKLWGGVKFVDSLPRTFSGKIAINDLKQMAKSYVQT